MIDFIVILFYNSISQLINYWFYSDPQYIIHHIFTHACMHTHTNTCIRMHAHMHARMHARMHAWTHAHTHTHTQRHACTHTHDILYTDKNSTYWHTDSDTHFFFCIFSCFSPVPPASWSQIRSSVIVYELCVSMFACLFHIVYECISMFACLFHCSTRAPFCPTCWRYCEACQRQSGWKGPKDSTNTVSYGHLVVPDTVSYGHLLTCTRYSELWLLP